MEPKDYAFRWLMWLDTLIIIWEYDWIPREFGQIIQVEASKLFNHRFFRCQYHFVASDDEWWRRAFFWGGVVSK